MKGKHRNLTIALLAALTLSTSLAGSVRRHHKAKDQNIVEQHEEDLPAELAQLNIKLLKPIKGVSRSFAKLNHDYKSRLISVFIVMKQQYGYEMTMLEGYRSPERQDSLSSSVTQAKGFQSFHQYGLASDCAFMRNGRLMADARDPWTMQGYKLLGEVAKSVGLVWGGNWTTLKDYGHTEFHAPKAVYAMSVLHRNLLAQQ